MAITCLAKSLFLTPFFRNHRFHLAIISLLTIHAVLLAYGAWVHSPTYNEPAHLAAGISYWQYNRFDIYSVNPPLVKLVAAIPVLVAGCETNWDRFSDRPGDRCEMAVGRDFAKANGSRIFWLMTLARWVCIPFSLLGAIICYRWATELYGQPVGLFAMALWSFCPNVIAHGQLITSDVASASLGVFACYTFWHWLKQPTWRNTLISAIALGLAESAKTTLLVLYPLWPILWLLYRFPDRHRIRFCKWRNEAGWLVLRMVISIYILNLTYGFEGSMMSLKDYHFVSNLFTGNDPTVTKAGSVSNVKAKALSSSSANIIAQPSASYASRTDQLDKDNGQEGSVNRFSQSWLGKLPVPFPKHYILGIDAQRSDFNNYHNSFFLAGDWSKTGWWYYYLFAAAIKVPIGTWLLLFLALVSFAIVHRNVASAPVQHFQIGQPVHRILPPLRDELFLLAPALTIFAFVSSQTGINEHFRYVLPCFPFIFIFLARSVILRMSFHLQEEGPELTRIRRARRAFTLIPILLLGTSITSSL